MERTPKPYDSAARKKGEFPPAPEGVNPKSWEKNQLALRSRLMPKEYIQHITTLRQMNLYTWLVFNMNHTDYKWIRDHEHILLAKDFKRAPGQA